MNWPKKALNLSFLLTLLFAVAACGVKGDPLPPEKPVELGRGRPTYKRATEGLKIEQNKDSSADDEDEDDER